jgi:hypothetical protein
VFLALFGKQDKNFLRTPITPRNFQELDGFNLGITEFNFTKSKIQFLPHGVITRLMYRLQDAIC